MRSAVCFVGAIGLSGGKSNYFRGNATFKKNKLVDYEGISHIMKKHLIDVNDNVDTFIHCWTPDVESDMVRIYKPKSFLFEENDIYSEEFKRKCSIFRGRAYNRASFLLSIQKSLSLMVESGEEYDSVLVIRPDVILFKNLILSELQLVDNIVYSNNGRVHPGDFFYLMNYNTSKIFRNMYEKIKSFKEDWSHDLINDIIINMPVELSSELGIDVIDHPNFNAGRDIQVSRKCNWK